LAETILEIERNPFKGFYARARETAEAVGSSPNSFLSTQLKQGVNERAANELIASEGLSRLNPSL